MIHDPRAADLIRIGTAINVAALEWEKELPASAITALEAAAVELRKTIAKMKKEFTNG